MLLQSLISVCLNIILSDEGGLGPRDLMQGRTDFGGQLRTVAPPVFCSAVIKMMAIQMQALGVSTLSLRLQVVSALSLWIL